MAKTGVRVALRPNQRFVLIGFAISVSQKPDLDEVGNPSNLHLAYRAIFVSAGLSIVSH